MEESEVLFKNTSKMNSEEVTVFQNFALKKLHLIVSIGFSLVFVAIGLLLIFFVNLTAGIIAIASGILGGFVLLPYLLKESVKKQNMQNLGDKKYLNTFSFYDDYIIVQSEESEFDKKQFEEIASQKLFYNEIFQIVLFREYLFIYINEVQSFILSYKGMTKGTIAETINFLKTKGIKMIDKTKK